MRTSGPSFLLFTAVCLSMHAFGQDLVERQSPQSLGPLADQSLALYSTASITKPSPGQFSYGMKIWQTNGTGWGRSVEYRRRIRGSNYGGILFSDTPTNSVLYLPSGTPYSWPIHRYEFDVLWTREFAPIRGRVVPYVSAGGGAILLDGGHTESGWDRQAALVAGAGSDVRFSRSFVVRAGFTVDGMKASTYSDRFYRSSGTIMVEPHAGFVWGFGVPHPQ